MAGSPVFSIKYNKKAFSFHHNVVKILLKWISAPEARDSTKACRFFPPVFSRGRLKGQDSMTSASLVTPCLEKKIWNGHPKTNKKIQNPTKPAAWIRINLDLSFGINFTSKFWLTIKNQALEFDHEPTVLA